MNLKKITDDIASILKEDFKKPSVEDIKKLESIKLPNYFIEFIKIIEPQSRVFLGDVRLLPIQEIIEENEDYVPGADVYPSGFTVFASSISGDAYCFNMNEINKLGEHDIYFVDHDEDFSEATPDSIKQITEFISSSFEEFILFEIEKSRNEEI
jgi:hypothetical protein